VACYRHNHCYGDNKIKINVRAYFYFRYRKKQRQQQRQTVREFDSVTFASHSSNIGKLIFYLKVIAAILALDCYAV
jgi:hypothetical protein